jgi:hypothetical protein
MGRKEREEERESEGAKVDIRTPEDGTKGERSVKLETRPDRARRFFLFSYLVFFFPSLLSSLSLPRWRTSPPKIRAKEEKRLASGGLSLLLRRARSPPATKLALSHAGTRKSRERQRERERHSPRPPPEATGQRESGSVFLLLLLSSSSLSFNLYSSRLIKKEVEPLT